VLTGLLVMLPVLQVTGTPLYMAPENLRGCHGMEVDVWAAGVMVSGMNISSCCHEQQPQEIIWLLLLSQPRQRRLLWQSQTRTLGMTCCCQQELYHRCWLSVIKFPTSFCTARHQNMLQQSYGTANPL
jgi:serine/threonine protein kinase